LLDWKLFFQESLGLKYKLFSDMLKYQISSLEEFFDRNIVIKSELWKKAFPRSGYWILMRVNDILKIESFRELKTNLNWHRMKPDKLNFQISIASSSSRSRLKGVMGANGALSCFEKVDVFILGRKNVLFERVMVFCNTSICLETLPPSTRENKRVFFLETSCQIQNRERKE